MLMHLLWLALGLVLLVGGAESLVRGASKLALSLGISPLVVGLTIVAYGTSSPEMAVSVQAAHDGRVDIAIGNVVGSNIFNVLFILGASALIAPLVVDAQLIRQEVPVMIGAALLLSALAADGGISRFDGALLSVLVIAYTVILVLQSRRATSATKDEYAGEYGNAPPGRWDSHWGVQVLLVLVGLGLLVLGSQWLVQSAVAVARSLGISELIVGLTIIAAGTSLPEVAASLMATFRGERDIAVGNVVGSCTFNILAVLGGSALTAPLTVAPSVMAFDLPVMVATAVACLPVFLTGRRIARWEGVVFLAYYFAYTTYLVLATQRHDGLEAFTDAMIWFVVPLTLVTLAASMTREFKSQRSNSR